MILNCFKEKVIYGNKNLLDTEVNHMVTIEINEAKEMFEVMNKQKIDKIRELVQAASAGLEKQRLDELIKQFANGGGGCGIGCC